MTKIMLVDDDVQVTVLLGKLLDLEGFQITAVSDSSQAYETAQSVKPNLFLLDLMMPDPDGFKLCRILRADPHFIFTPIFIVTALDDYDSCLVAYDAGATDYIVKPFHSSELVGRIRKFDGYIPSSAAHETSRMKAPKRPKHKDTGFIALKITRAIQEKFQEKLSFPDSFNRSMRILWFLLLALIIIYWLLIKLLPPIR
jgi:DNA-binding response OmpR family regulator